jgi:hypothetical protein
MQMSLAFFELSDPPASPSVTYPPPATWTQLDETARIAALKLLAPLIARMLAAKPAPEASHE